MLIKLRRRFILINMTLIGGILAIALVIAGTAYYSSIRTTMIQAMQLELENYANPKNTKPAAANTKRKEGWEYITSLCIVHYSKKGGKITVLSENPDIDLSNLEDSILFAAACEDRVGSIPKKKLIFSKMTGHGEIHIAFSDTEYLNKTTINYVCFLFICLCCFMVILYFISLFLANTAIRPIDETLKKQKRFIADVSHELKTPLTVILANDKILRSHASEPIESQLAWIDSTKEEAERMKLLVADMLTLARNESPETVVCFSKTDLSRTVSRVFLQFEAVAYEKNLSITSNIDDDIYIRGDEAKLKQLSMALIDNAIKYEPQNGSVVVELHHKNGKIVFSVQNSGSVISKEDIPHIFERFYRSDTSRSSAGYGLGLPIAYSIVQLHKGTLRVKSDEQSGTVFEAIFPKVREHKIHNT